MTARRAAKPFPIDPPIEPILAKLSDALPRDGEYLYEPKWDGFRAIVFRGGSEIFIQSRDSRPFDRYFPDLHDALLELLPRGCVIDGEIVLATPDGLDFDALQMRLHPRRHAWPCSHARLRRRSWRSIYWRPEAATGWPRRNKSAAPGSSDCLRMRARRSI